VERKHDGKKLREMEDKGRAVRAKCSATATVSGEGRPDTHQVSGAEKM